MKRAIPPKKKTRKAKHGGSRPGAGRPATGKEPVRTFRLSDEFIASVDEWAASYEQEFLTRSDALRALVLLGLKSKSKVK